jgi:hypothetical protein
LPDSCDYCIACVKEQNLPVGHMVMPCHSRCISMTRCQCRPAEQVLASPVMPVITHDTVNSRSAYTSLTSLGKSIVPLSLVTRKVMKCVTQHDI